MGFWRKREQRTRSSLKRTVQRQRLLLEELEPRRLLSVSGGTWTPLTNVPSGEGTGTMLLLSNGTVMAQAPDTTNVWYQLTPDASGSYINGTISQLASMNLQRKDYTSDVLPNGNVIVVGGEESGPSGAKNFTNTGEIYNPQANTWTSITPFPQSEFGDDPSEVLPNGTVLAGYINGAKTYIYNPATDSWSPTAGEVGQRPERRGDVGQAARQQHSIVQHLLEHFLGHRYREGTCRQPARGSAPAHCPIYYPPRPSATNSGPDFFCRMVASSNWAAIAIRRCTLLRPTPGSRDRRFRMGGPPMTHRVLNCPTGT